MATAGSGGYGGISFSQVSRDLSNVAFQFTSILSLQMQIKASLGAWRDLSRELSLTQAAAEGTNTDFIRLEAAARNFALASTFSAGQAANSFYDLASAGLSVTETMQAASGVLLLAQATLSDLGQASDLTASTLAQFNLQASESYRISNLFVASTNSSLATINKLAFAFRQVGPIASQMNLSLEQTTGMLDKLFDAGLRGEQAGTALRNLISRITSPQGQGNDLLKSMGINSTDSEGRIRPLIDILKDLQKAQIGVQDAGLLVGVEGASGFQIMLNSVRAKAGETTSELEKHINAITNTNAAYKQAVVQMNTLDGTMSLMSNNFTDLQIILGQQLAPVVGYLATQLGSFTAAIRSMTQAELLSHAGTALMVVQGYALVKALQMGIGSAGAFRTSIQQMTSGLLAMRASVNMGFTMAQNFTLAGSAIKMAAVGISGFVSAALPLVGVGVAVYGIYQAWQKVNEEAAKARVLAATGAIIQNTVETDFKGRKLKPGVSEALADQNDYSGAFASTVDRTKNLANVSADGSGAFQYFRMQTENIKAGTTDIDILDTQINILRTKYAKVQPKYAALAKEVRGLMSSGTAGNIVQQMVGDGNAMMRTGENGVFQKLLGSAAAWNDNDKLATQYAQSVVSGLSQVGNAPTDQAKQAFEKYYNNQIATVKQINGISATTKKQAVDRLNQERAVVAKADTFQIVSMQAGAKKAAETAQKALVENSANSGGINVLSDAFNTIVTELENNTVLTPEEVTAKIAEFTRRKQVTQAAINRATKGLSENDKGMIAELTSFVASAGQLTNEQTKKLGEIMATPEGRATRDAALAREKQDNGDIRAAAIMILEAHMKDLGITKNIIKERVDEIANYAIIDPQQVQKLSLQSRIRTQEALQRLAEINGSGAEVANHFNQAQALKVQDATTGAALSFIHRTTDDGNQNIKAIGQALQQPTVTAKLNGMFKDAAAKTGNERAAAIDGINNFVRSLGQGGIRDKIGNVRDSVAATVDEYEAIATGSSADQAAFRDAQATKTSNTEKYVKDLLNLPTKEQMFLNSQKMALEARFALSDYFNLPLQAVEKEAQSSELDYRTTFQEFTTRYRKFYSDTLAKGINGATSDTVLADAFSGKLMERVLGSEGNTEVFGRNFNRQMLSTTEGLNLFVKTIQDKFANVVGDDPAAAERIAAAGKMLTGMTNEVLAVYDKRVSDMRIISLKRQEVEQSVRDFQQNFSSEQVVEAFRQAASTGIADPGMVDISVDVAINARTAQINLDTESAISQMRAKYKEAFANLGVGAVYVNGQFQFADGSANVSGQPRGTPANDNGGAMRTVALPPSNAAQQPATGGTAAPARVRPAQPLPNLSARELKIMAALQSLGLPPISVAAMMANAKAENDTFDPKRENSIGARGVYQYLGSRKDNLIASGGGSDLDKQLAFMKREIKTGDAGGAFPMLMNAQTPEQAMAGALRYVRPDGYKRNNPKATDDYSKRMAYMGRYSSFGGVSENSIPDEADPTPFTVPTETPEEKAARTAAAEQLRKEWNDWYMRQRKIQVERVKFAVDNAQIFGREDMAKAAGELFTAGRGAVNEAQLAQANRRGVMGESMIAATESKIRSGDGLNKDNMALMRASVITRNIANLDKDRYERLQNIGKAYAEEIGSIEKIPENQDEINRLKNEELRLTQAVNSEYDKRIANAPKSLTAQREANDKALAAQDQRSDDRGGNTFGDIWSGFKSGAMQATNQVKSFYELTKDAGSTALNGMSDALFTLFSGVEGAGRKAREQIADMMSAIAKMIIQMLVLKAIQSVMGFAMGGVSSGNGPGITAAQGLGGAGLVPYNGPAGGFNPSVAYADGGIHRVMAAANGYPGAQLMDQNALNRGGIRAARNPAFSIHGEGGHPEAYIPMVDRRSIPVHIDDNGRAVVPLPSGQTIPVTIKMADMPQRKVKTFSQGGTSDNVIPWSKALAMRADRTVNSGQTEAVSKSRGKTGSTGTTIHMGDRSYSFPISLTYSGNATPEDTEGMAVAMAARVMEIIDKKDQESRRQQLRSQGGMASQWGVSR